jgi:hypothetical protein
MRPGIYRRTFVYASSGLTPGPDVLALEGKVGPERIVARPGVLYLPLDKYEDEVSPRFQRPGAFIAKCTLTTVLPGQMALGAMTVL